MTQSKQIEDYLDEGNRITQLDALNLFKCFRLASRISDIQREGRTVQSRFISTYSGKRVKEYWFEFPMNNKPKRTNIIQRNQSHHNLKEIY